MKDALVVIVHPVTLEHGERFAAKWFEIAMMTLEMCEAFSAARVMTWPPDGPDESYSPAQERYHAIEDEIMERTFAAARPAIAEAFVKAANEVLDARVGE